ncbi:MAG: carbon starvation protein A [Candidatus Omnitrophica bacterium]|nr:carbon starvation protein A [Candidatus Omnitrophota bacterium]
MNSLIIVALTMLMFWFGYAVYAKKIEAIFKPDPDKKTPAYFKYDGTDYVPAKHWTVLFGHHFSSIAGAAPIVGPILAVSIWGWAPVLLWVVLGTVFIGGVHDYASLMASVRHQGSSIADFSKTVVSKNTKYIFLAFLWVALILIISVFVDVCARTFVVKPEIVMPSLGLIPVAMTVGYLMYIRKANNALVTIFGLLSLAGLVMLGNKMPITASGDALKTWSIVLLVYAYFASIMPVQILLQPRDYLSAFLLVLGLTFGYVGIFVSRPNLELPAFVAWRSSIGDALWPVLFITVACGAVSGFHAIVSGGTTSKQITNETHAKRIGYGAMIAEGLVAAMALLVVAAAFSNVSILQTAVKSGSGPAGVFGTGYGLITKKFLGNFGQLFAILLLNAFVLTTLDTAARIGRYLTEELFKVKNRYLSTLVIVSLSGWLGLSGRWNEIWPIFGAANQLIAALTLIVITSWLLSMGKRIRYTFIPMVFMLVTTVSALVIKIKDYINQGNYVLLAVSVILLCLSGFILFEAVQSMRHAYKQRRRGHA